jgi:hypothetical protein
MPYGERWRYYRKMFTRYFNQEESYKGAEKRCVNRLLVDLLESQEKFFTHLDQYVNKTLHPPQVTFTFRLPGALTLDITYGITVKPLEDPYIQLIERTNADSVSILSEHHLIDIFPSLRKLPHWMPGAGFHRKARHSNTLVKSMLETPMKATERDLVCINRYHPLTELAGADSGS